MSATQRPNMRLGKAIRGFVLPAAIFLLVVLAALGAAIVTVSTTQQIGSALDVQGTRAYQAARAGIEWGLYQRSRGTWMPATQPTPPLLTNDPCSTTQTSPLGFPVTATTFAGFTVSVTCTAMVDTTNSGPTVATITATACNQPVSNACPNTSNPNSFYVERQMTVTF